MTVAHNSDEWRWADPQGQQRTIRADELRAALVSGAIAPNAPVWRKGFKEWQAANTVAELMTSALAAENGVLLNVPPPPLAIVAVQHAFEGEGDSAGPSSAEETPPPPPAYVPLPPKSAPDVSAIASAPPPAAAQPPALISAPAATTAPADASAKPTSLRTGTLIGFAPTGATPLVQSDAADELSSSHLIPADSSSDVSAIADGASAPRYDHSESVQLPFRPSRADQLGAIVKRGQSVAKEKPKVVAIAGGALLVATIGIYFASRDSAPSASTATVSSASVKVPSAPARIGCKTVGASRAIAPHATPQAGIELVASGDRIGIGFAASPRKAITVSIDPVTFDLIPRPTVESPRIAHVLPLPAAPTAPTKKEENRFSTIVDPDVAENGLSVKRSFVSGERIDVGVRGKSVVLSKNGSADYADLFALADGEGPVEAIRAATLGENEGVAVAFRRNSSIWLGIAQRDAGELKSTGLFRFAGSSAKVGAPSIATFGNEVLVTWADRVSPNAPWTIKTGRWGKDGLAAPKDIALPPGGKGEQGMSPSVVPIDKKRALLTWAEGPVSSHEVRAQVMTLESTPIGAPFALSEPGMNAGQPQAALLRSGKGLAAFFVERGRDLQVSAVQIECSLE